MTEDPTRSTDPRDYQDLPQAVGAMSKAFADGWETPLHSHARVQLLFATRGIMRLRTDSSAWIVPRNSAVYIPAGTRHAVSMHGDVDIRTLYIDGRRSDATPPTLTVIAVSNLLRELILALSEEPVSYPPESRAARIASLIEVEICQAEVLSLNVPLPSDPRLQRICAELLADPSDRRSLERWSEIAGASPRTLARLFESDLGMGFNRWRQRMRFHNALDALSNGEPISVVAKKHGYNSPSAFTSAFTKTMGSPPRKHRGTGDRKTTSFCGALNWPYPDVRATAIELPITGYSRDPDHRDACRRIGCPTSKSGQPDLVKRSTETGQNHLTRGGSRVLLTTTHPDSSRVRGGCDRLQGGTRPVVRNDRQDRDVSVLRSHA